MSCATQEYRRVPKVAPPPLLLEPGLRGCNFRGVVTFRGPLLLELYGTIVFTRSPIQITVNILFLLDNVPLLCFTAKDKICSSIKSPHSPHRRDWRFLGEGGEGSIQEIA